jgi:hypothetical protein
MNELSEKVNDIIKIFLPTVLADIITEYSKEIEEKNDSVIFNEENKYLFEFVVPVGKNQFNNIIQTDNFLVSYSISLDENMNNPNTQTIKLVQSNIILNGLPINNTQSLINRPIQLAGSCILNIKHDESVTMQVYTQSTTPLNITHSYVSIINI